MKKKSQAEKVFPAFVAAFSPGGRLERIERTAKQLPKDCPFRLEIERRLPRARHLVELDTKESAAALMDALANLDRLLSRGLDRPDVELGRAYSKKQKEKSKKGASARWGNRDKIKGIIETLADNTDEMGDHYPSSELWSELYAILDREHLSPRDTSGETVKDTDRMTWDGNTDGMTYKTFRNRITEARKK